MLSVIKQVGPELPPEPIPHGKTGGVPMELHGSAPAAPREGLSPEQVAAVVKELNEKVGLFSTSLQFSVDEATGKTVITVLNAETGEMIRQIPAEEMLRVAACIRDLLGVLFDQSR